MKVEIEAESTPEPTPEAAPEIALAQTVGQLEVKTEQATEQAEQAEQTAEQAEQTAEQAQMIAWATADSVLEIQAELITLRDRLEMLAQAIADDDDEGDQDETELIEIPELTQEEPIAESGPAKSGFWSWIV